MIGLPPREPSEEAQRNAAAAAAVEEPRHRRTGFPSIRPSLAGQPLQIWDFEFDGSFEGEVEVTLRYDDRDLLVSESALTACLQQGLVCTPLPVVSRDVSDNLVTVRTPALTTLALTGPEVPNRDWSFQGTAASGLIRFTVGLIELELATSPGESASDVVNALANLVNADTRLTSVGISATPDGPVLTVDGGWITSLVIDDPGLSVLPLLPPAVPALPPWAATLLAGLLAASGAWRIRARSRTRTP